MLTREQILGAADFKVEEVPVPEWGGSVFVRTLSAGERDRWELYLLEGKREDVRATLAARAACDAEGKLLFEPADIKALSAKSAAALSRIFDAAIKLNKVSKDDVEELEKN